MTDYYNALDDTGVVHTLEKTPVYVVKDGYSKASQMGFTWCMIVFTWKEGPRYHSLLDGGEARLTQSLEHATCLTCLAAESGVDLLA